ncbi:uncharacterized protein V1518DRAFT_423811 [Limtongia smithiae]|uniref:uncharacterized protein n=1 Tax=Limtongia smithiae TaxID=1125753 RepID=UPI0034CE0F0F
MPENDAPAPNFPSLYDGLDSGAVVARAPVAYSSHNDNTGENDREEAEKKKLMTAALQFPPVHARSGIATGTVISKPPTATMAPASMPRPVPSATLDAFTSDHDPAADSKSSFRIFASTSATAARKPKQRKTGNYNHKRRQSGSVTGASGPPLDWDDSYDLARPNSYEEYIQSEEKYMEDEDWRAFLLDLKLRNEQRGRQEKSKKREADSESEEEEEMARLSFGASRIPSQFEYADETTISRAPLRYAKELPSPPSQEPAVLPSAPENKRQTFAKRLLTKYGWAPGTGLGADNNGIATALHFSANKNRKGHGKIVDRNAREAEGGKFGRMSKVVVLSGLVAAHDVDETLAGEIGAECDEKYGTVEQVFVHIPEGAQADADTNVYIKFTSDLSALRAVNGLDKRLFNGREIMPRYFDESDFASGRYIA